MRPASTEVIDVAIAMSALVALGKTFRKQMKGL
jgi:hypothetical protein